MINNSLDAFAEAVRQSWGPISSEVIVSARMNLERLLNTGPGEQWLDSLHRDAPANRELYRDPEHGFVLLAHTEPTNLYRPPHDHGGSWVIYGVQQGVSEMTTYARVAEPDGVVRLVQRSATLVRPGQVQVYLPGDIHDTRCIEGPSLLYRLTQRDLKKHDKDERRITRFIQVNGVWVAPC